MTSFAPRQPVEGPNPYDAAQTFAESSVTVSTDKTKVEGGSIELSLLSGTGITFSLDNSTLSSVDSSGAIVNPNSDLNGVEVTAASGPSSLGDATLETTGGTVLDQAAIAPGETLTLQGTLTSGTDYRVYITANSIGSDYERPNFPVGTTDIDVTNGFYNGSSSQYVSLTKDITAIFGDATSGQAHVEWSAPTDIYGWDVTTFTRSPDGETVDVYVAVDGRPVRNARLRRAVVEGYGDLLPDDRAPIAVVSVSLPTAWADHNVHPRKREVRLRDAEAVASAIASTVGDALSTADVRHAESLSTDLDASLEPLEGADSDFTDVRVLGQFRDLYVLCERGSDLLVVDQHAAHERVNYERLRAAVDGDVPSVAVDPPEHVRLTPAQSAAIEPHRDALAAVGYDVDLFGDTSVRVHSVPAPLGRTAAPETVRDAIDALRHGETPDDGREDLLKDLACHPSLKAGTELPDDAASELVERLGACENPYACPHGRPTVLTIDEATFVRGFGRRGTRMDR